MYCEVLCNVFRGSLMVLQGALRICLIFIVRALKLVPKCSLAKSDNQLQVVILLL